MQIVLHSPAGPLSATLVQSDEVVMKGVFWHDGMQAVVTCIFACNSAGMSMIQGTHSMYKCDIFLQRLLCSRLVSAVSE